MMKRGLSARPRRWLWMVAMVVTAMAVQAPGAAWAQDDDGDLLADEDFKPPPEPKEATGTGTIKGDLDLYWGGNRKEDVIVGHLHEKGGRFELGLFTGIIPNDPYLSYVPIGGRFAYFFTDSLGVEAGGSWTGLQSETDLTTFLLAEERWESTDEVANTQQWRANAVAVWSPFYGKLALLQRKLSHFDLNVSGGLGVVQLTSPTDDAVLTTEDSIQVEIILGAGARVFLTEDFALRLDYRQGIIPGATDEVLTPVEFSLGISYLLGGE